MNRAQGYRDRREAGQILAKSIPPEIAPRNALVLALPRGGVPVGFEVARRLGLRLDVIVVRKLGAPEQPELAIGAIATGDVIILHENLISAMGVSEGEISEIAQRERIELTRRERVYRGQEPMPDLRGRMVFLVDDGLATGFTMRAAVAAVRAQGASPLLVTAPVGSPDTCRGLAHEADAVICPLQPEPFEAVGLWYEKFLPTTDDEVHACLAENRRGSAGSTS